MSRTPDRGFEEARARMVDVQIARRGVRDPAVLSAMRVVPREAFVPPHLAAFACDDSAMSIGHGQTISQPYIVALMVEALQLGGGERVLEVGTGTGYAAAVTSRIAGWVYTVERLGVLAAQARERLQWLGFRNIEVIEGDGTLGWEPSAPYDGIVVTAGGPEVPATLRKQLALGGRLVMPVGRHPRFQRLVRETRGADGGLSREDLCGVCFVPLIGVEGWGPDAADELGPAWDGGPG